LSETEPVVAEPPAKQRARLVLAGVFVLLGLWILHDFLPALGWAVVLAIALWPLYERLLAVLPTVCGRIVAPLVLTLGVGVVFVTPLVLLGIAIARETHIFVEFIIMARHSGVAMPEWIGEFPIIGSSLAEWWHANLSDPMMADALFGHLNPRMLAESAREYGGEIARRLVIFLFTLLTLFFLFRDGTTVAAQMRRLSDRVMGERGERIGRHMIGAVHGTVTGLVLVGLAEGIVLGVFYIFVGLPYPASIAAVTGILAVIPFGAPIVYTIASLYLLSVGKTVGAIVVFAAGTVVIFIADHLVRPVLIGGAARLPFIWVLLGLLGGLESLGFIGLFLGPAIMAALLAMWRDWTDSPEPEVVKHHLHRPRRLSNDAVRP
jgi:predicted PurR-regulated permease PerM